MFVFFVLARLKNTFFFNVVVRILKKFSMSCNRNEYEKQRGVAQNRKLVCVFVSFIERNEKFVSPRIGFTTSFNYKHNTLKHK